MYGLDQKRTAEFGTRCLLARRLVERGVRFVQIYSGGGPVSMQWDAHTDLVENHEKMCGMTDQPIAALLQGSEAARAARFHAGDLGQRVRPPADDAERQRARPQSARLHHVVCRRRRQGRTGDRRDGRIGREGRRRPLSHARFPRHDSAPARAGAEQLWYLHNGRQEKLTDFGGTPIERVWGARTSRTAAWSAAWASPPRHPSTSPT